MALSATLTVSRPKSRRAHERRSIGLVVGSETAFGPQQAVVHDISRTGLLLESDVEISAGEQIIVHLLGETRQASVVWRSGRFHGCAFEVPLTQSMVSAAILRSPFETQPGSTPPAPSCMQSARKIQIVFLLSLMLWAMLVGVVLIVLG